MSLEQKTESIEINETRHTVSRPDRFTSHALVEVRRFKHLPMFCHSAVLLDISISGFKIEFTSDHKVEPGFHFWLNIPLSPLGIYAPKRLLISGECRWFDSNRFRVGGVFLELNKTDALLIGQIIETIESRNT